MGQVPHSRGLPSECCLQIKRGVRGIHVKTAKGQVLEATAADWIGTGHLIQTRYLNGDQGPTLHCRDLTALERTYENGDADGQ